MLYWHPLRITYFQVQRCTNNKESITCNELVGTEYRQPYSSTSYCKKSSLGCLVDLQTTSHFDHFRLELLVGSHGFQTLNNESVIRQFVAVSHHVQEQTERQQGTQGRKDNLRRVKESPDNFSHSVEAILLDGLPVFLFEPERFRLGVFQQEVFGRFAGLVALEQARRQLLLLWPADRRKGLSRYDHQEDG